MLTPHKRHSSKRHKREGICLNRPIGRFFANYKKFEVFCNLRKELRLSTFEVIDVHKRVVGFNGDHLLANTVNWIFLRSHSESERI